MIFDNIRKGFQKTKQAISNKFDDIFGGNTKIDEDLINEIEDILVSSDVGIKTSNVLCNNLKSRIKKEKISNLEEVKEVLREEMYNNISNMDIKIRTDEKPLFILVVGVNGVGKTTTIGKLAKIFKDRGNKVLLGAGDTFRAGAIEQLEIWSNRVGVPIVKKESGSDPGAVVFDTIKHAKENNTDVIFFDTAGRLHNKKHLMDELAKIKKIIDKELPNANKETLMIVDSTTGQNAIMQTKIFTEITDVTGIVLTKLDGTAKGGVVFAINEELKVPVKFIGIGEQIDDIKEFNPKEFVESII